MITDSCYAGALTIGNGSLIYRNISFGYQRSVTPDCYKRVPESCYSAQSTSDGYRVPDTLECLLWVPCFCDTDVYICLSCRIQSSMQRSTSYKTGILALDTGVIAMGIGIYANEFKKSTYHALSKIHSSSLVRAKVSVATHENRLQILTR